MGGRGIAFQKRDEITFRILSRSRPTFHIKAISLGSFDFNFQFCVSCGGDIWMLQPSYHIIPSIVSRLPHGLVTPVLKRLLAYHPQRLCSFVWNILQSWCGRSGSATRGIIFLLPFFLLLFIPPLSSLRFQEMSTEYLAKNVTVFSALFFYFHSNGFFNLCWQTSSVCRRPVKYGEKNKWSATQSVELKSLVTITAFINIV